MEILKRSIQKNPSDFTIVLPYGFSGKRNNNTGIKPSIRQPTRISHFFCANIIIESALTRPPDPAVPAIRNNCSIINSENELN
jgi:hypothetical protein